MLNMLLLQAKQQLDDIQELYWKLQSSGIVTELNSTLEELVWASDIVRSRAFAIAKRDGALALSEIYITGSQTLGYDMHGRSVSCKAMLEDVLCVYRVAEPQEHWHCSLHGQCCVAHPLLQSMDAHQAGETACLLQCCKH